MATIAALPYDFECPIERLGLIVIDMQRDFIEPGGFGEALGNDVRPLGRIVPVAHELLDLFRRLERPIVHTQEGHAPDLSDCPPAKLRRGEARLRIGDPGPMGRVLIEGEPGFAIVPDLAPRPGDLVIRKPGKGAFLCHGPRRDPARARSEPSALRRGHDRGVRADNHAGSQRPGLRVPAGRGCDRELFPGVQVGGARHDPRPGRDRRLDGALARRAGSLEG